MESLKPLSMGSGTLSTGDNGSKGSMKNSEIARESSV